MRSRRIRHVPVVDTEGFVVGLVSIGDMNAWRYSRCEVALHQVEDYVWRRA
jgi:CBS-domain-containing membrane protein